MSSRLSGVCDLETSSLLFCLLGFELLASVAISKRRVRGELAAAKTDLSSLLLHSELQRREFAANVAGITERLLFAEPARAPEVVLRAVNRVLHDVRAKLGGAREGLLVLGKASYLIRVPKEV